MSDAALKKPAKAPAAVAAALSMTLSQAKDAAFTELSQAVDLISSARSAANNGHYLERTLRMAEEIAIDVLGDMDHGRHDRHEWSDRMFDCQSLLMCAAAYNESATSTLAARHAAKHLDHATNVLDQLFQDELPATQNATPGPVELTDEHDPRHMANMALGVVETLSMATDEQLVFCLERLAAQLCDEIDTAVRNQTAAAGDTAAVQLNEVLAMVTFMSMNNSDRDWNALNAVEHCFKQALQLLNEMRRDWA